MGDDALTATTNGIKNTAVGYQAMVDNTTGASVWIMTYYTNGNLSTITDPVGYKLIYSYDDDTATHVTKIQDNFAGDQGGPYYSTATYNPLFGQVRTTPTLMNIWPSRSIVTR